MWQTKSSLTVFEHKYLTVIEDDVVLPDGKETKYLKIKLPHNACSVITRGSDGKILLQKQYNYPINTTLFEFPGGGIPSTEPPAEGAKRELLEETGYIAQNIVQIGEYYYNNRRSDSKMLVFYASDLTQGAHQRDSEEQIELFWYTTQEIDELIRTGQAPNPSLLAAWCIFKNSSYYAT